jgi:hypothetical protein
VSRRLTHAALLVGVSLAAAQLIRADRRNPAIEPSQPDAQGAPRRVVRRVRGGKMPGSAYTLFYPEAQLSAQDIDTICAAAR